MNNTASTPRKQRRSIRLVIEETIRDKCKQKEKKKTKRMKRLRETTTHLKHFEETWIIIHTSQFFFHTEKLLLRERFREYVYQYSLYFYIHY